MLIIIAIFAKGTSIMGASEEHKNLT